MAKADADNAVVEANEGNNVSAASAPFTLGPDLVAWLDVPARRPRRRRGRPSR